jgi:hypothetical protein
MNEGTSTSASLITDTPAFEWGEGHAIRLALADLHTKGQFAAQTIVLIDSGFYSGNFWPTSRKTRRASDSPHANTAYQ